MDLVNVVPEVGDCVGLDESDLFFISLLAQGTVSSSTHIRVGFDLSNRSFVELSSVRLPVLDLVLLLDTGSVTLEASLVDIVDPSQMGLDGSSVDARLEGNDELSRDDVVPLGDGSGNREDSWKQSSEEDRDIADVDHGDDSE